jgi:hypothetical protein
MGMSTVFINYRTDDDEGTATLIDRELSDRFGSAKVFRASRSIRPGENFEEVILRNVQRSEVLLAIIGPRWLTVLDGAGRRKIDLESDWTRQEILEAMRCKIPVIPVLVGKSKRLTAEELPAELAGLVKCQYVPFDHRRAARDLDALVDAITERVPELDDRTPARDAGEAPVINYAGDNARVKFQGVVNGNVSFARDPEDER